MKVLGNLIWHIPFLGFVTAGFTWLFGLLLTLTIVAAPLGLGLMEYGKFLFWPFGNAMASKDEMNVKQNPVWEGYSLIITILYFPFGAILAVVAIFQAIALAVTVIGIPAALVIAKSLGTFLNPVNKICVDSYVLDEVYRKRALGKAASKYGN